MGSFTDANIRQDYTTNLYGVQSVVKEYRGYKDVTFCWFYAQARTPPRPYADLIKDYDPNDHHYAEGAIDELFTWDEANQLVGYLDREHGDAGTNTIKEVTLPLPNNSAGFDAVVAAGFEDGEGIYRLFGESVYSLPFEVEGYFDLTRSRGREVQAASDKVHQIEQEILRLEELMARRYWQAFRVVTLQIAEDGFTKTELIEQEIADHLQKVREAWARAEAAEYPISSHIAMNSPDLLAASDEVG